MQERLHHQKEKTCWSVVINTLSYLSSKKLFIFYLLASSQALAASKMQPLIFFRGNRDIGMQGKKSCVQAAPDCLLIVSPADENFGVKQICNELQEFQDLSLVNQMRKESFVGQTLCVGIVTSGKNYPDGSVSINEIDFNMPGPAYTTSQSFFVPQKIKESSTSKPESVIPIVTEPPKCRVGMWAETSKNEYYLIGTSNEQVSHGTHYCRVVPPTYTEQPKI